MPQETLRQLFGVSKPIIGVVHLRPLPGSPKYDGDFAAVVDDALSDAALLERGGLNGLIIENYGDVPFYPKGVPPETVAAIAVVAERVKEECDFPIGLNVLRNDARSALGIAAVAGTSFIRVNVHVGAAATDQGIIEGTAYDTMRVRARLCPNVLVFADVMVKHSRSLGTEDTVQATADLMERGLADAAIVTGEATGKPADMEELIKLKSALPEAAVLVGSGVDISDASSYYEVCDGLIVGSSLKVDGRAGNRVDGEKVVQFVRSLKGR